MHFKNDQLGQAVKTIIQELTDKDFEVLKAHAECLMDYIYALMERRKVKQLYDVKNVTDVLLASAYLYQAFYVPNCISTLFLLREKSKAIFAQYNIESDTQDKIFQMCECHAGEDSLAEFLIPQKGYPDDLFADAIFMMSLLENKR